MSATRPLSSIASALSLTIATLANAQGNPKDEIDLQAQLHDAIFAGKPYLLQPGWKHGACYPDGHTEVPFLNVRTNIRCYLDFSGLQTSATQVDYSGIVIAPLPDGVNREARRYSNCSSDPLPIQDSMQVSYTEGTSVTVSSTFSSGTSSTLGASVSIPLSFATFGVNGSYTVQSSSQNSNSSITSNTQSKSYGVQLAFTVPPHSVHTVILEKEVQSGYVDFTAKMKVSGGVGVHFFVPGNFNDGYYLDTVENLIPNFPSFYNVRGRIWNVKGINEHRTDKVDPIPAGSVLCSGAAPRGLRNPAAAHVSAAGAAPPTGGVLTIEPFVSGMAITTSDSVSDVQVRVKSLGPGACAVSFSSSNGWSVSLVAPPLVWTDWSTIFSHLGSVTVTLSSIVNCDTGTIAEVKYFK